MRFLFIHQFFAGPDSPGPAQPRNLVRELARRGHAADVIAGDFNAYNEQDEPPEHHRDPSGGEWQVHRLPVPRNLRASLANRLRTYGHFAFAAYRYARRLDPPDAVLASIQPLFSGVAAKRLAHRLRRPFLLEIRDLWPDALVVRKAIAPWQAWPLERMARSIYFGADRVVCLTPGLKAEILKKGVPPGRIDLFPNAYDERLFDLPPDTREQTRRRYGWDGQFVAVYTGTHTPVTAIDCIVRAAGELRDRPDIRIDLFGSGQSKAQAMEVAQRLGLTNIHFHDAVAKSRVPAILAGADAGLMTLFQSPLVHIYFENKLIDYMAAGLPILAAMDGIQPRLIEREGAGRVVPGLDYVGLARLIRDAAECRDGAAAMGRAGHTYICSSLTQTMVLARYADALEALARGRVRDLPVWDPLRLC